ncbi:MAG: GIY-YIG nuclease family protein [Dehalococcoidia bacterium]
MTDGVFSSGQQGVVYCLINAAMPGYVKIGLTTGNVADRMRQLDTTGVPLPFECVYAVEVADVVSAERLLHEVFGDVRVRPSREFFEVGEQRVIAAMRLTGGRDVTPSRDIVEDVGSQLALDRARRRRAQFNFQLVGVTPGTVLTFSEDESITCTVVDDRTVDFEGQRTSLSAAALIAMRRFVPAGNYFQRADASIQGTLYWELDGESMSERRRRLEVGEPTP